MSNILSIVLLISLAGTLGGIIFFYIKNKNLLQMIISLLIWIMACAVLFSLFGGKNAATAKGSNDNEVYFVIILYIFMFIGMIAEQGFSHFSKPLKERKKKKEFDIGPWLVTIFASPIIFIPLLAALQNVDMNLMNLTTPRLMVFFVAFENGFFWKGYLQKRQEEIKKVTE